MSEVSSANLTRDGLAGSAEVARRSASSTPARSWSQRIDWILVLIVVVAGGLRFWKLGAQSLWFDEFFTTQVVSKGRLLYNVAHHEGTPPLYFIAVWGWTKVFGDTDAAFRSLSAVVGTATVPVVYATARELVRSRRIARVAAVLVAVNPMFVWFSQEARAYSLFAFAGSLSLLFCVRARAQGRMRDLLLWGVASAAALCTHYFAVFLILPEAVWLVLSLRRRWTQVALGAIPLVVAGLWLYLFFFTVQHAADKQKWISKSPVGYRVVEAGRQTLIGPGGPDDRLWMIGVAFVLLAAVLVVVRGNRHERTATAVMVALAATGLLIPLAAAVAGSDYLLGRNLIASLVPLAVAVAIGLGASRAGWVGATATAGLCILSTAIVVGVATDADLQKADWRSLAARIDTFSTDSVVVIDHDSHLALPLVRYFKDARVLGPNETVRVKEIDLVYYTPNHVNRCGLFQGRACESVLFLFPLFPQALTDRFVYGGKPTVGRFAVNRYGAAEPVSVRTDTFVRTPTQFSPVVIVRRAHAASRRGP